MNFDGEIPYARCEFCSNVIRKERRTGHGNEVENYPYCEFFGRQVALFLDGCNSHFSPKSEKELILLKAIVNAYLKKTKVVK
jgi:hypothetical protein